MATTMTNDAATTASGRLRRARLCRRARQADRGLPRAPGRGLDLRPHHRRASARSTTTSTSRAACPWSSPTTTSPAPSPSCGRCPTTATIPNLTPEQIGNTWLNYLIERRTILWWGGIGNSTEHTAYLRLKSGIPAPASGSIALNGKTVAEQIGSQIFIDGWGMIAPGDPELAADFARRAGSVSHDGEAIYGAQVIAAMEAQAFVESDLNRLIDVGRQPHPRRLDHRPPDRRHPRVARGRARLAKDARADRRQLRLRQVRRQLPHGAEPRPDHPGAALRRRRFPASR